MCAVNAMVREFEACDEEMRPLLRERPAPQRSEGLPCGLCAQLVPTAKLTAHLKAHGGEGSNHPTSPRRNPLLPPKSPIGDSV